METILEEQKRGLNIKSQGREYWNFSRCQGREYLICTCYSQVKLIPYTIQQNDQTRNGGGGVREFLELFFKHAVFFFSIQIFIYVYSPTLKCKMEITIPLLKKMSDMLYLITSLFMLITNCAISSPQNQCKKTVMQYL